MRGWGLILQGEAHISKWLVANRHSSISEYVATTFSTIDDVYQGPSWSRTGSVLTGAGSCFGEGTSNRQYSVSTPKDPANSTVTMASAEQTEVSRTQNDSKGLWYLNTLLGRYAWTRWRASHGVIAASSQLGAQYSRHSIFTSEHSPLADWVASESCLEYFGSANRPPRTRKRHCLGDNRLSHAGQGWLTLVCTSVEGDLIGSISTRNHESNV